MDLNKPTIIFTNFWDAKCIVENGGFLIDGRVVRFSKEEAKIESVALAQPKGFNHPNLKFFNPSWDILKAYKANRDWDDYTKSYRRILVENKAEIVEWIDSLPPKVYFLCCWENTSKGANCHRRIIFDSLRSSKRTKDSANYIYRHGDKQQYNAEKQVVGLINHFEGSEELTDFSRLEQELRRLTYTRFGVVRIPNRRNYQAVVRVEDTDDSTYVVFEIDCDHLSNNFEIVQGDLESTEDYWFALDHSNLPIMEVKRRTYRNRTLVELCMENSGRRFVRFYSANISFKNDTVEPTVAPIVEEEDENSTDDLEFSWGDLGL